MYTNAPSRRPWRGSATVCWFPDKMVSPISRRSDEREIGNCHVTYKTARTKQRRLDRWLTRLESGEWDE